MQLVNTQFAESNSSGLGALGVDAHAFVIQLITFVLAYFVLRKYAFGPILKVLNERRETIESGVKLGEEMQKERAKLDDEVEEALQASRRKADGIIADAQDTAKQTVRAAEDKAKVKAQGVVAEAEDRIAQDTQRARKQLEKELVSLISDATEAIIDEKVDAKKDAQLIDRALKGARS
ncbi:MAG: F0F1 ATP synthase subunit B [Patescibacteria group bacterium]|nr:F0F1 ATP synthase subunit B [Patescibacteria group bacterium]